MRTKAGLRGSKAAGRDRSVGQWVVAATRTERLWIDVEDEGGDFSLCLDEATWDGELLAWNDSLRIRLRAP
jgi:hypothetical protein